MTSPTPLRPAEAPASINQAMETYYRALSDRQEALGDIIDVRYDLDRLVRALDDLEAEVLANGGFEKYAIDGKNAEERKAQLRVALAHHPDYRAAQEKVNEAKRLIARAELLADTAYSEMRGVRLRIEHATSWNNRLASGEAASVGKDR